MGRRRLKILMMTAGLALTWLRPAAAGTYSAAYPPILYVPVSAKASSLGNSLYCDGDVGARYNPAFLGTEKETYLYGTYGSFRRDTSFNSLGARLHAGELGLAFAFSQIGSRFDRFTGPDGPAAGTVGVTQSLVSFAVGAGGGSRPLVLGAGAHVLVDSIDGERASGFGLDVGGGYLFSERLRAGITVNDFVAVHRADPDRPPVRIVLAAAWVPELALPGQPADTQNVLLAALAKDASSDPAVHLGAESRFYGQLALRAGYDRDHPVAGVGFTFSRVSLDAAASFKDDGPLYFMTLGYTFAPQGEGSPAVSGGGRRRLPEAAPARKAAAVPVRDTSKERVREGWSLLKEGRLDEAGKLFAAVLEGDPGNRSARRGMARLEKEREKRRESRRLTERDETLSEGERRLEAGEYGVAEKTFALVLERYPSDGAVRDRVRGAVSGVVGRMRKAADLKLPDPTRLDAMVLVRSGGFSRMCAAAEHLEEREYGECYGAWTSIEPKSNVFVRRCGEALSGLARAEVDRTMDSAKKEASSGAYAAAVERLKAAAALPWLETGQKRQVQALINTYEYVGRSLGKKYIANAEKLMEAGRYRAASAYLEQAVSNGFEADRARRLQQVIRSRMKNPDPPRKAASPSKKKAASSSKKKKDPAKRGAEREPEKSERPSSRERPGSGISEELRVRLIAGYSRQAASFYSSGEYRKCRECLEKILYLQPDNGAARTLLRKVNGLLKEK